MDQQTLLRISKSRCNVSDTSAYDADFKDSFNLAQQNITTRFLFDRYRTSATMVTTAGTSIYTLPSNTGVLYNLTNLTSTNPIENVSTIIFDRIYPNSTAQGSPRHYKIGGIVTTISATSPEQSIEFFPIPDGPYQIRSRFYFTLPDMVNVTDVSLIPSQYHELLIHYACSIFFEGQNDNRATVNRDKYESMLLDLVSQYGAQPSDKLLVRGGNASSSPLLQFPPNYPRMR